MRSVAVLLPALVAASPVAQVVGSDGWANQPDPKDIQIVKATFSGNGCPQGTVSTNISPDKTVGSSLVKEKESCHSNADHPSAGHHLWLRRVPDLHWTWHFPQ